MALSPFHRRYTSIDRKATSKALAKAAKAKGKAGKRR